MDDNLNSWLDYNEYLQKNIPIHIIQRGNNRQVCFGSDDNHSAYAGWLKEYSKKYKVDVHAWVMMTNHVHLLCTPHPEYMMLGADSKERCHKYRTLFDHDINDREMELIRSATNKGMVVGNDRFRKEIEALTGRRVKEKRRGRPIGWRRLDV